MLMAALNSRFLSFQPLATHLMQKQELPSTHRLPFSSFLYAASLRPLAAVTLGCPQVFLNITHSS